MFRTRKQPATTTEETDMTWTAYPPRDYPEREWIEDESSPWYVAPDIRDDYALAFPRTPTKYTSPQVQPLTNAQGFPTGVGITWKPATEDDLRGTDLSVFDPTVPLAIVWLSELGTTWTDHRRTIRHIERTRAAKPQAEAQTAAGRAIHACRACGTDTGPWSSRNGIPDSQFLTHKGKHLLCSQCRAVAVVVISEQATTRDQVTAWLNSL